MNRSTFTPDIQGGDLDRYGGQRPSWALAPIKIERLSLFLSLRPGVRKYRVYCTLCYFGMSAMRDQVVGESAGGGGKGSLERDVRFVCVTAPLILEMQRTVEERSVCVGASFSKFYLRNVRIL